MRQTFTFLSRNPRHPLSLRIFPNFFLLENSIAFNGEGGHTDWKWAKIAIFPRGGGGGGGNFARGQVRESGALWRGSRQSIRGFEGVEGRILEMGD